MMMSARGASVGSRGHGPVYPEHSRALYNRGGSWSGVRAARHPGARSRSTANEGDLIATFADLAADNPNIWAQDDEWRNARAANGEDAADYEAFRQRLLAIGAPDPGAAQISDCVGG